MHISFDTGLHPLIHKILSSEGASPRITAHAPDEGSIAVLVSEELGMRLIRCGSEVYLDGFTNNFMTSGQRIIT